MIRKNLQRQTLHGAGEDKTPSYQSVTAQHDRRLAASQGLLSLQGET